MVLMKAWGASWTPDSHYSFQPAFQNAAWTVILSAWKLGMPKEVGHRIVQFLRRDAWPDDRRRCWSWTCEQDAINRELLNKNLLREGQTIQDVKVKSFVVCKHCRVASYCSGSCRKTDWKDWHKQYCNVPPCKIPSYEEDQFIRTVLSTTDSHGITAENDGEELITQGTLDAGEDVNSTGDNEDAEGWEDVDSDEEEEPDKLTKTKLIYNFFLEKSYKPRGIRE